MTIKPTAILLTFLLIAGTCHAQDSLVKKEKKQVELGISLSTPLFVLLGVTDHNERYTNLTGRYFITKKHAVKAFAGVALLNEGSSDYKQTSYPAVNQTTVFPTTEIKTPSNFQLGLGYEYVMGKRKLKTALGIDVLYNNKFESTKFYYLTLRDSLRPDGQTITDINRLDTGGYIHNYNLNKLGINFSYSLRYALSKRWLLTGSFIMSYKIYRRKEGLDETTISDFNLIGLVSDISLFYRF